jgi:hypothetical protein
MRDFAEQVFIGALIESFSLILSYVFKDKPRNALFIFATGTIIAGLVAFFPKTIFLDIGTNEPITSYQIIEITATKSPSITQAMILDTPTSTPESQVNNWNNILVVRIPTLNEIRAETPISLWDSNNLNVRDMTSPGVDSYSGEAQYGQEYLFPVYWCATSSDLLASNMDNITTVFTVNGETVPEKYVFRYNYDTNTGWKCNYHAIVLGGWSVNAQYTLEITRTLLIDLSDGQTSYSSGEYVYRLKVKVR